MTESGMPRRLRLAVVGGSYGFIGPVHRTAARIDDRYELVAGVLSSDPGRGAEAAARLGIRAERAYATVDGMLAAEHGRPDGIEVVAIMTPNAHHFAAAMAALDAGLDVICDKPVTTTVRDAEVLAEKVRSTGRVFCLTYNYTGYPMVRQARAMIRAGRIGEVRQIHVTYVQGHNATLVEGQGGPVNWRFDPAKGGPSLICGDIGTHAVHLAAFVSSLELQSVMADIVATVPGRASDDYAGALLRWTGNVPGTLWITNAAAGAEHGLVFRIFGSEGGLEWHQEHPNALRHRRLGDFEQILTKRLHGALLPEGERATRVEIGHPEGYQEAFATLYREAADAILARSEGTGAPSAQWEFPSVQDGVMGMRFIDAAVRSARERVWVDLQRN